MIRLEKKMRVSMRNTAIKCGKIVTVMILLIQLGVLLNICRYTFFSADDYWHAVTAGGIQNTFPELWSAAWDFMRTRFYGWQGTFFSMFLQIFLCPLNWNISNPYRALHIILVVVCLLFFFSLYLFNRNFAIWIGYSSEWVILCGYTILVTALLNTRSYYENFFWFSGITSYTIPLTLSLLAGAMLLRKKGRKTVGKCGKLSGVGVSVLLFLACGGSLEIALPICYVLFIWMVNRIHKKSITGAVILAFAAAMAGTFINGAAPGNYARHAVTAKDSGAISTLWHAGRNTLFQLFDECGRMFDASVMAVMVFAAMLLGCLAWYHLSSGVIHRSMMFAFLIVPIPALAIFPVVLGYGSVGLPERTYLMLNLSLAGVFLSFAFCAGAVLSAIWKDRLKVGTILLLLILLAAMTDQEGLYRTYEGDFLYQLPMATLAMDSQKGWVSRYYQDVVSFYDGIANSEEMNVTADTGQLLTAPKGLMPLIILDADSLAQYYGKTSISVVSDAAAETGE